MKVSHSIAILLTSLLGTFVLACDKEEEEGITGFVFQEISLAEGNSSSTNALVATVLGSSAATEVSYTIREGTATFGLDITESSGMVQISNNTINIPPPIIGDEHLELEETFDVVLEVDGDEFIYEFIILDDDAPAAVLEDQDGYYTPNEYPSMTLTWSEEFDGTELDTDTWTYELGNGCDKNLCGWGNNEQQEYTSDAENIRVADGMLTIEATQIPGGYHSARIITQDKVELTYGRIDVRAKMPKGQGLWPAIWMLGANIDDVSWPMCGEIDIMELVGHTPAVTHGTVHYDNGDGYRYVGGSRSLPSGDLSEQFHVYSIVWNNNEIDWYLDNVKFQSFSKTGSETYPFNRPFFFIMNVAVGGNWPGNPDATTTFPQSMTVDYIRVFN